MKGEYVGSRGDAVHEQGDCRSSPSQRRKNAGFVEFRQDVSGNCYTENSPICHPLKCTLDITLSAYVYNLNGYAIILSSNMEIPAILNSIVASTVASYHE